MPDKKTPWFGARHAGLAALFLAMFVFACGGGQSGRQDPALIKEANALASQGSYWYDRGCYSKAERYFQQSLEKSRLLDDLSGMTRSFNNLGATNLAQGHLDAAAEYLYQAQTLNARFNAPVEESLIQGNFGGLAYKAGKLDQAETFWRKAAALAAQNEGKTGLALHLSNLGMLLRNQGRSEEAEIALKQAQTEATQGGLTRTLAGVHHQLGLLYQSRGNLAAAEENLTLALTLDKESENPRGIAKDLEKLGLLSQEQRQWEKAAMELDRAFYLSKALGDWAAVEKIYSLLEKNRKEGGKPETTAGYLEIVKKISADQEPFICRQPDVPWSIDRALRGPCPRSL